MWEVFADRTMSAAARLGLKWTFVEEDGSAPEPLLVSRSMGFSGSKPVQNVSMLGGFC